jgi:pimeloyl-ACP methyl ester carboxylesterase
MNEYPRPDQIFAKLQNSGHKSFINVADLYDGRMFAIPYSSAVHPKSGDCARPALPLLLREMGAFASMRAKAAFAQAVPTNVKGDGRDIVVLPGFMASDTTTARLRKSLESSGFRAHGWGLGRNFGVKADIFDRLDKRLDRLGAQQPITLIGWSLGGLIAREYAKHAPDRIAQVITLGSPFSGDPRANNAWRLYEWVAGHSVDAPPIAAVPNVKPPVSTIALWSRRDGVVSPRSACGEPGETDSNIELQCSHMAFVADPVAIRAICQAVLA